MMVGAQTEIRFSFFLSVSSSLGDDKERLADAEEAISSKGKVGRRRLLIPLFCRSREAFLSFFGRCRIPPQKRGRKQTLSLLLRNVFFKKRIGFRGGGRGG